MKLRQLRFIFSSLMAIIVTIGACKGKTMPSDSVVKSEGPSLTPPNPKLVMSKALDKALEDQGFEHSYFNQKAGKLAELSGFDRYHYSGNILSTKTGHCLGLKKGTYELEVTDSSDLNDGKCPTVHLYSPIDKIPRVDQVILSKSKIIFNHGGEFRCLQMNGLGQRATIEPCLTHDPNNIQTFDWDAGTSWGLVRQSGDKSKALCLDIENENRYDRINFFNCAVTGVGGKGIHQRFWLRYFEIRTIVEGETWGSQYFNKLTLID
jgi:hypothetical protein